MSWLARSIANSLRLDEDEDDDNGDEARNADPTIEHDDGHQKSPLKSESEANSPASTPSGRGVKDDLSELTKSISRQFWGVASFLAPPPESEPSQTQISDPNLDEQNDQSGEHSYSDLSDEDVISGIRSDFAEISGKFKSGISRLSGNKAVSEITKIASNFLQFGSEEERSLEEYELGGVVGVTEEVVAFARNLAMHPETWLDFPLPDGADSDDFELSDAQQEHALAVERLAPRLAALRMELCPVCMSDGCFWKIYFVLLHPRLSKKEAELLSSPEIMEARAMLTIKLNERRKEKQEADFSARGAAYSNEGEQHLSVPSDAQLKSEPLQTSVVEAAPSAVASDVEMEKHPVQSTETEVIDKSVVEEAPAKPSAKQSSSTSTNKFSDNTEDEADDWLNEEDDSEIAGVSGTSMPAANDDDVSFSDLEEEDGDVPVSYKKVTSGSDSSTKDSRDWVQLGRSSPNSDKDIGSVESRGSEHAKARNPESKDSNDWLNVDDIDVM